MSDYRGKRIKQQRARKQRARYRIRARVSGTAERPRLAVSKSLSYVYAQVIDDERGHTLAQASSAESEIRSALKASAGSKEAAKLVGETIAKRAKEKGIEKVVFDRGGSIYHGKVKAVAEGARSQGLEL